MEKTIEIGDRAKLTNDTKEIFQLLLAVVIIAALFLIYLFRLWFIDLSVPFIYASDTLWFIVPIKGMIDNGWTYYIPQLSAPFGLSAAGFPSMTNFDWLIMKVFTLFVADAGVVLNVFWLFSIILTACTAVVSFHLIGVNKWMSVGAALVYAFLPYAFLRNVAHISLVYYTVPLLVILAIYIAKGCEHPRANLIRMLGYGAIIVQGFNYIYFSFFAVLLFLFSGLFGYMKQKSWKPLRSAALASAVMIAVASLNLAPSFFSWFQHGKPQGINYKIAAEAEIYGLKLRKMLVPNVANQVPLFKQWAQSDRAANFPNENENVKARLGPMAAVGLLFLLFVSFGFFNQKSSPERSNIKIIASLALFCFLFTTVGGFSAIFNQIIPEFRCPNRFSVFIAFLALVGLALWWQEKVRFSEGQAKKLMFCAAGVVLIVFSLYDQMLDAGHLNNRRSADEKSAAHEREVVRYIESKVPAGTAVFQLPVTGFPVDPGVERMAWYDHARPFLWSNTIHWSWPSFSQQHRAWLDQIHGLEGKKLAEALVLSNFDLVWIDRFGYSDNGEKVISSFLSIGLPELKRGMSDRYVVIDLRKFTDQMKLELGMKNFMRRQDEFLRAPIPIWDDGFYSLERKPDGRPFRWSRADSSLKIRNQSDDPWSGFLSFYAVSGKTGDLKISSRLHSTSRTLTSQPERVQFPLMLDPHSELAIVFSGKMGRIDLPPNEIRDLHFYIMDLSLRASEVK